MRFTEEHAQFRKSLRDFLEREISPFVDEWEAADGLPAHEVFRKLGSQGLLGLEFDPAYGGPGADHSYTVVFGEELGRIPANGVSMAISVQTDMATPSLARFGTEELKQRYLVPALKGDMVASIAVTEPDAGSDVAGLRTRAVRDGDEWVINGSKIFITNGTQADWLCLLCRTSEEGGYRGMSQIVFPTDTPGFRVSRKLVKMGNWSSDTAELSFTDCRVPVANTIGEVGRGFQQQMQQFQNERMIANYMAIGQIEHALERTKAYLRERVVFGKPLVESQHIQFVLAELYAELDMLRAFNYQCCEAYLHGDDTSRYATVAKLMAGRLVRKVADACIQFHGGLGYMEETWTARFFRDSRLTSIGGGADEVMLRTIAKLEGMPTVF
jgi:citronellyl-CoA dehydrogenase